MPVTLSRMGTARQLTFSDHNATFQPVEHRVKVTAAEPDFAITGSATFTLAVIAMSLIS